MLNHKERAHALLSASGASKWLACPPSARLEDEEPDFSTEYTEAGTLAHEIAEWYLRHAVGDIRKRKRDSEVKKLESKKYYSTEMLEHAEAYATYVKSKIKSKNAMVLIEERLDYSDYVPEGFGTGDCIILQDGVATFVDYKYGQGVSVSAEDNTQLKMYDLGIIQSYGFLYDIDTFVNCIFQPRLKNTSEFTLSRKALEDWAENIVKPTAEMAYKGEGDRKGGSHCGFCKVKAKCKAFADWNMEVISEDFEDESSVDSLSKEEVANILARAKSIKNWLSAVEAKALQDLLGGKSIPNYKVVEGRSNRQYSNPDGVLHKLKQQGFKEDELLKPRELLPIGKLEKLVGKKDFEDLMVGLVVKPSGKPTVVPVSDKRPELSQTVINDFDTED